MDSPTSQKLLSRVTSLSIKKSSSPHRHKRAIARSPHTPFPSPAASPAVINRASNPMEMDETDQALDKYTKKIFQLKTRESYLKKFHDDCEDVLEYLDRQASYNKAYCNTFHHFESDFVHYLQHAVTQLFSSTEFANNLEEFLKLLHEFIFQPNSNNHKTPAGATALFGVFDTIPDTHLNPILYSLENAEPWMRISVKEGAKVNGYSAENFIASEIVLDESKSSHCVSVLSKFIHNPDFKTAISGCFYLVNYFSCLLEIDSAAHYPVLSPCIQMLVCEATDLLFSGNYDRMKDLDTLLGELTKMDCTKTHELSEWLKEVSQLASKLVDLDFKYAEATKERLCLALERGNWMMGNNELQDLRDILQKISHSVCTTLKDALTTKRKEVKIGMKWQKVLKTTIDSCLSSALRLNEDLWMSIIPTFIKTVNGCALPPAIHHYNQATCTLSNLRCELNLDKSHMRLDYGFDTTSFESNELLTAVISNVHLDFHEIHCWISGSSYQELSNHYFDASGWCTLEIEFNSKPFHLKRVECCAPMQFSNFNIHSENLMVLMSNGAIKNMIENRVEQIVRDLFEESTMTMEESLLYHEQHQRFPLMSRTDTLNSR